jgi:type IV pilus assembly protein PilX
MSKNFTSVMNRKKMIYGSYGSHVNKQKGVVLIVGLIMVLLMTIVGLAAIKGSGLQENMASNMRDMNVTFQAAESGLNVCEDFVDIFKTLTLPEFKNADGFLTDQQALTPPAPVVNWTKAKWDADGRSTNLGLKFVSAQPRCVVEQLEYPPGTFAEGGGLDVGAMQTTGDPQLFRITSVSYGFTEDTRVVLQATHKRPFQ